MKMEVAQEGVREITQDEIDEVDGGLMVQAGRYFAVLRINGDGVQVGWGTDQGSSWRGFSW